MTAVTCASVAAADTVVVDGTTYTARSHYANATLTLNTVVATNYVTFSDLGAGVPSVTLTGRALANYHYPQTEFVIGASDTATAVNLAEAINRNLILGSLMRAWSSSAVVYLRASGSGTTGNLYALAASTTITASDTTFTDGTAVADNAFNVTGRDCGAGFVSNEQTAISLVAQLVTDGFSATQSAGVVTILRSDYSHPDVSSSNGTRLAVTTASGVEAKVVIAEEASDSSCYPIFVTATVSADNQQALKVDSGTLQYDSSAKNLKCTTFTGALTGNASTATAAATATIADEASDSENFVVFTNAAGSGTAQALKTHATGLKFNASTGVLTATGLAGPLTGNASTATLASTVTVADEGSDAENFVVFTNTATGSLALKTHASALKFNASTGQLSANLLTANEASDTTCFPAFVTAETGSEPKTNASLTFNSSTAALGATSFVAGGNTLDTNSHLMRYQDTTITANEVKALNGTPKVVVTAPASGYAIVFCGATLFMDYATTQYVVDAGDDIRIQYATSNNSVVAADWETTGWLDAAVDKSAFIFPNSTVDVAANAADALELTILSSEVITGDSPLKVRVFYRIVPTTL